MLKDARKTRTVKELLKVLTDKIEFLYNLQRKK